MKNITKDNYLQELFVNEAKAALTRDKQINNALSEALAQVSGLETQISALDTRLSALEPSKNLLKYEDISDENTAISPENYEVMITYDWYSSKTMSEMCPDMVVGKTYTFSCYLRNNTDYLTYGAGIFFTRESYYQSFEIYPVNEAVLMRTFIATEDILNSCLQFDPGTYEVYEGDDEWGNPMMMTYEQTTNFKNIMLNEGEAALPFEPGK